MVRKGRSGSEELRFAVAGYRPIYSPPRLHLGVASTGRRGAHAQKEQKQDAAEPCMHAILGRAADSSCISWTTAKICGRPSLPCRWLEP
jgi:hypothetical protein